MNTDIERLLRLAADFHAFCEDPEADSRDTDGELWEDDLDLVAAAAGRTPQEARQDAWESGLFRI